MSESSERGPAAVTPEVYRRIKSGGKMGWFARVVAALGLAAATAGGAVATGKIIERTGKLQPGEIISDDVAARFKASRAPVEIPVWDRPAVTLKPKETPSTIEERAGAEIAKQRGNAK